MKTMNLLRHSLRINITIINDLKVFIFLTSSLLLTSCIGIQSGSEPWEGITGNTLKVTVYEFFLFEEKETTEDIKNHILAKLNQRAGLLIASHISINLSRDKISKDTDNVLNNIINEITRSGRLVYYDCNENNYCSANSEYNIADLLKTLESINNQK